MDMPGEEQFFQLPPCQFKGKNDESVKDFLFKLRSYMNLVQCSQEDLLALMPYILLEEAFTWYKNVCSNFNCYSDFEFAFLNEFLGETKEGILRVNLLQRTQQPQEQIYDFILEILELNSQLRIPFSDQELLNIMRANMQIHFAGIFSPYVFPNLYALKSEAQRLQLLGLGAIPQARDYNTRTEDYKLLLDKLQAKEKELDDVKTKNEVLEHRLKEYHEELKVQIKAIEDLKQENGVLEQKFINYDPALKPNNCSQENLISEGCSTLPVSNFACIQLHSNTCDSEPCMKLDSEVAMPITLKEIVEGQPNVAWCCQVLRSLTQDPQQKTLFENYDDILYRQGQNGECRTVVVPEKLQERVFDHYHVHAAPDKDLTYLKMKQNYFWLDMKASVRKMSARCATCNKKHVSNRFTGSVIDSRVGDLNENTKLQTIINLPVIGTVGRSHTNRRYSLHYTGCFRCKEFWHKVKDCPVQRKMVWPGG